MRLGDQTAAPQIVDLVVPAATVVHALEMALPGWGDVGSSPGEAGQAPLGDLVVACVARAISGGLTLSTDLLLFGHLSGGDRPRPGTPGFAVIGSGFGLVLVRIPQPPRGFSVIVAVSHDGALDERVIVECAAWAPVYGTIALRERP